MQWYEIIIIIIVATGNMFDFFLLINYVQCSVFAKIWANGEFMALTFCQNILIDCLFFFLLWRGDPLPVCAKNQFIYKCKCFGSGFMCDEDDLRPIFGCISFELFNSWINPTTYLVSTLLISTLIEFEKNTRIVHHSSFKRHNDRLSAVCVDTFHIALYFKGAQIKTKHQKWIHYPIWIFDVWRVE